MIITAENNQDNVASNTTDTPKANPFASLFQDIKPIMELDGEEDEEPEEVAVPKKRGRPRKNPDELPKGEKETNLITGHIRGKMAEEFKKRYHVNGESLQSTLKYLAKKYDVSYCQAHAAMESEL